MPGGRCRTSRPSRSCSRAWPSGSGPGKRIGSGSEMLRAGFGLIWGAGVLGGLATLSKLNGALGGMVLAGWACLAIVLPTFRWRAKATFLAATVASGCVSFATFAALNPFLFANPRGPIDPSLAPVARLSFLERVKAVADHRVGVSRHGQSSFPADALRTPLEKVEAVAVQGFGRFGHFGVRGWTDSTTRFDWEQDWGVVAWLPWVVAGVRVRLGPRPGAIPGGPASRGVGGRGAGGIGVGRGHGVHPAGLGSLFPVDPAGMRIARGVRGGRGVRSGPSALPTGGVALRFLRRPEPWVFVILLASYGYFWQGRDWNSASRLMLTYALVDRGTLSIERPRRPDRRHRPVPGGTSTATRPPGYSLLATAPYALAKAIRRLPDHPLDRRGFCPLAGGLRDHPGDFGAILGAVGRPARVPGARPGLRPSTRGPRRARLRPGDSGLHLRHPGLWASGRRVRPAGQPRLAPQARIKDELPIRAGGFPGGLRERGRDPGRPGFGDPGVVSGESRDRQAAPGLDDLRFRGGRGGADSHPPGLQPSRLR